ncbi:hypothetical protein E3N88_01572 [Mikania micrantha]|uniref:Uncharacterized protein n=1 Tax=Mikania micrantha TaxID=192012 RepID=A0A5N6Q2X8_9ASTR|nr:hypothetical protein E3N88_01572 [Mikania micrantha]
MEAGVEGLTKIDRHFLRLSRSERLKESPPPSRDGAFVMAGDFKACSIEGLQAMYGERFCLTMKFHVAGLDKDPTEVIWQAKASFVRQTMSTVSHFLDLVRTSLMFFAGKYWFPPCVVGATGQHTSAYTSSSGFHALKPVLGANGSLVCFPAQQQSRTWEGCVMLGTPRVISLLLSLLIESKFSCPSHACHSHASLSKLARRHVGDATWSLILYNRFWLCGTFISTLPTSS